jgi:predicted glycosyltransferase
MTRRPIDLPAVRRARAELARLAVEHPEAFDPDRLPVTAEAVGATLEADDMANRKKADPVVPLGVRLPQSMLDRIDAVAADMQRRETYRTVTRADAIRFLLLRALENIGTTAPDTDEE